jgi:hypothetical protein
LNATALVEKGLAVEIERSEMRSRFNCKGKKKREYMDGVKF